jgi:hypothetical protein
LPNGNDIETADGFVYAPLLSELDVIDVHDPGHPVLASTLPLGGSAEEIRVVVNTAYLTVRGVGLVVVDVSNPARPAILATLDTSKRQQLAGVSEGRAFVWSNSDGMQIVDVNDRLAPVTLATFAFSGQVVAAYASGSSLVLGDIQNGIQIIDVSDPKEPSVVIPSVAGFPDRPTGVIEKDGIVYASTSGNLLALSPLVCPSAPSATAP